MSTSELTRLAWKVARVRGLVWPENNKLVKDVETGAVKLDPVAVAEEVETSLKKYRLHPKCADHVREYGSPIYGMDLDSSLCHGCAKPMECTNPNGSHEYRELSAQEARNRGIYHGGRCYHVEVCTHCGHVFAYDSSD